MDFTDLIKYIVDNAYNHWCITSLFIFLFNPFNLFDIFYGHYFRYDYDTREDEE